MGARFRTANGEEKGMAIRGREGDGNWSRADGVAQQPGPPGREPLCSWPRPHRALARTVSRRSPRSDRSSAPKPRAPHQESGVPARRPDARAARRLRAATACRSCRPAGLRMRAPPEAAAVPRRSPGRQLRGAPPFSLSCMF